MMKVRTCASCSAPLYDELGRERLVEIEPDNRFCSHGRATGCWDCEKAHRETVSDDSLCSACRAKGRALDLVNDQLRAIARARRTPDIYRGLRKSA